MGVLEDAFEVLKTAVIKENKPYTYKLLSRHLDIHVNDAKKLLYTFYKKYEDLVEATYLISGNVGGTNDLKIKVTKDINDKEKFDKIQSIQIYSLSPQNIEINEIVATVNAQIQEYSIDEVKLAKWGLIKGPALVKIDPKVDPIAKTEKSVQAPVRSKKAEPKQESAVASKEKEFPDMGLRSAQILYRNKKKEDPKARTATQPTFGSSNKQTKTKPERSKTEPAQITKRELASNTGKDKKQKELESMFDDADDDIIMEETSTKKDDEEVVESIASNKNEDLEGIFDSSFSQTQSQLNKEEGEADESEVIEEGRPEEELKEEEKEEVTSYYDEDGYLVTKVAEKPKAKPTTKPTSKPKARAASPAASAPAKKLKTTGSSAKQQSSLMSFFGKK